IYLDLLFMLVDEEKTVVNYTVDVTPLLKFTQNSNGSVQIAITVELPEALPDVVPEGTDNSGFGSDLEDWDAIDIPLEL
ncbi:MAG: hypothetical protein ACRC3Z_07745, partial [Phocaeicola sp.]